jgi:hypothetical protein
MNVNEVGQPVDNNSYIRIDPIFLRPEFLIKSILFVPQTSMNVPWVHILATIMLIASIRLVPITVGVKVVMLEMEGLVFVGVLHFLV